jgi:hypothetical protein
MFILIRNPAPGVISEDRGRSVAPADFDRLLKSLDAIVMAVCPVEG